MSSFGIIPGEQFVSVISAMPGGFAEEVLRRIAHPIVQAGNKRKFGEWKNGMCAGSVLIEATGEEREVVLRLGVKEGLFIEESEGRKFSLKHECNGEVCVIPVAEKKAKKGKVYPAGSIANNIVATWVIHGRKWRDRSNEWYHWPYGIDMARKTSQNFEVCDGAGCAYAEALEKGIVRSAHLGTWKHGVTLVPAASGIPVFLHEFEERADGKGKNDLTVFGDQEISPDKNIWGPYARWSKNVGSVDFGKFSDIAKVASSPFAFHVAATRKVFPNCELNSAFILRKLGSKLIGILKTIAAKDPGRFYRLIDEAGNSWKLDKISEDSLVFSRDGESRSFPLKDVPSNVWETFCDLSSVQDNPEIVIKKSVRIVPDSHFFIVLSGILTAKNGECHYISGNYMHEYMTTGKDAYAHRIRNERIFGLVKDFFRMDKLKFFIYPSNSLRLSKLNQYTFKPESWNEKYWLTKQLI